MQEVKLTKHISKILRPALYFAKGTVKTEIEQGISQLHRINDLFVVTRKEGAELVIVAAAGRNLIDAVNPLIAYAKLNGCKTVRWHTRNPEHIQHAFKHLPIQHPEIRKGFFYDEYIYRLVL